MNTLADFLRGRLIADPRAHIGALEIQHSRILLNFGAIGDLPRVVLGIEGNTVLVLAPELPADEPAAGDDLAEKLKAAEAEIVTLKGTIELLSTPPEKPATVTAVFDGERLFAGEGGPEIDLPEAFFEFVGKSLVQAAAESPDGAGGTTAPADTDEGAGAPSGAAEQPKAIDPAAHTRDELVALAAAAGLTIAPKATKADIAAALNAPK